MNLSSKIDGVSFLKENGPSIFVIRFFGVMFGFCSMESKLEKCMHVCVKKE